MGLNYKIGSDEDHVHFLIQSVPTYAPCKIVQIMKSITAREIFKKYLDKFNIRYTEHPFKMECFETGEAKIKVNKMAFNGLPMGLAKTATIS